MSLLILIFGLIVGSFLNAVIFRLHDERSFVRGRSQCMKCKTELKPMDLIPVLSFLLLGGRCRYCKTKLSWQYPAVELGTGIIFIFLFLSNGLEINLALILKLYFASLLIVIGLFDFKHFLILDRVVFPNLLLASLVVIYYQVANCTGIAVNCGVVSGVLAAALASGFFLVQYVMSSGRWIGFGDVKLGLLLGAIYGWPMIIINLFLAYILGALAGTALVLGNRRDMSSQMPLGTFLALSGIITLGVGDKLLSWYLKLLGF